MSSKPRIHKMGSIWVCSGFDFKGARLSITDLTIKGAYTRYEKIRVAIECKAPNYSHLMVDKTAMEKDAERFWRKNVRPGTTFAGFEGARRVDTVEIILCIILAVIAGVYVGRAVAGIIHSCGG